MRTLGGANSTPTRPRTSSFLSQPPLRKERAASALKEHLGWTYQRWVGVQLSETVVYPL